STYGHDVTRHPAADGATFSTVRLSLLRGPRFPDPRTDQGTHRLRCRLVVGAGISDAVAAGYDLNLPERVHEPDDPPPGAGTTIAPLIDVVGGTGVVETIKLAEDRSGDVIVRIYEPYGGRSSIRLRAGFAVAEARSTNL